MLDVRDLPAVNATLNSISAILLVAGWFLIRRRRIAAHRNVMIAAVVCSTLFLISYLVYHAQVGSVRFQGPAARAPSTSRCSSPTPCSPPPCRSSPRSPSGSPLRRRYPTHRRIARWALPIWLYVSVTGVVVYWMLYQMTR